MLIVLPSHLYTNYYSLINLNIHLSCQKSFIGRQRRTLSRATLSSLERGLRFTSGVKLGWLLPATSGGPVVVFLLFSLALFMWRVTMTLLHSTKHWKYLCSRALKYTQCWYLFSLQFGFAFSRTYGLGKVRVESVFLFDHTYLFNHSQVVEIPTIASLKRSFLILKNCLDNCVICVLF